MSRIAVIGNLSVDRIDGGPPRPGGGVFHASRAAKQIGAEIVAVTRCAPRDRGLVLDPLEALGPPVVCGTAHETTAFSFRYEGDHRVMTVDAVGETWWPEDLAGWAAPALGDAEWLLVAGLLRTHFPASTLEALAQGGRLLLLDAQGLVRVPRLGPLERDGHVDRDVLRHLAVLKLSEDEARLLAGSLDPARLLALGVPEIVLTLGSEGARVVADGIDARIAAEPLPSSVDPTGAGDAFSLVYLDGRAARGLDPVPAAERASREVARLLSNR